MATNTDATKTQDTSQITEQTTKITDTVQPPTEAGKPADNQIGSSTATSTTTTTTTNAPNATATQPAADSTTDHKSITEKASDVATKIKDNVTDAAKAVADKTAAIVDSVSTSITPDKPATAATKDEPIDDPTTVKSDPQASITEKLVDAAKASVEKSSAILDSVKTAVSTTASSKPEDSASHTNKPVDDPTTVKTDAPATGTDKPAADPNAAKKDTPAAGTDKPVNDPTTVKSDAPATGTDKPAADPASVKKVAPATSTDKPAADPAAEKKDAPATGTDTPVADPTTVKKDAPAASTDKPVADPAAEKKDAPATTTDKPVADPTTVKKDAPATDPNATRTNAPAPSADKPASDATAANKDAPAPGTDKPATDAAAVKKDTPATGTDKPASDPDLVKQDAPAVNTSKPTDDSTAVKKDAPATNTDKPATDATAAQKDAPTANTGKPGDTATETKTDTKPSGTEQAADDKAKKEAEHALASTNQPSNEDSSKVSVTKQTTEDKKQASSQGGASSGTDAKGKEGPGNFPIKKGNAKNLTEFQRKKAEYFFNVNLDHDDKKSLSWSEVEEYLLFHLTTANKVGPASSELEAKLSRAGRALWEHIFDEIPSADGKRDQLTLDQFLDFWASLIDYIVEHGQLPSLVQDLVDLGFELYSNKDTNAASPSIPVSSFEQLFEKMNLGRPYALMAHKFLTDNGTKPLDKDKVNSTVRAVITSSDDGHPSHFLLPGFFKLLSNKAEKTDGKTTPSPSPSPTKEPSNTSPSTGGDSKTTTPAKEGPTGGSQPAKPSPPAATGERGAFGGNVEQPSAGGVNNLPSVVPKPGPGPAPQQPQLTVQQLDNQIRSLLHFYHIDDSDIVEVADGPAKRIVVVHPERPLPAYLKQGGGGGAVQQFKDPIVGSSAAGASQEKPKVTLEERVARGEAQVGPTVPLRQEQQGNQNASTGIKQVFPQPGTEGQQGQQGEAKVSSSASAVSDQQSNKSQGDAAKNDGAATNEAPKITPEEEKKIVEDIIKRITPLVEELVASELHRIRHGGHLNDDDDEAGGFMPFPFVIGGGPAGLGGGVSGGPAFIPPELLMNLMNDLSRGNVGDGQPGNRPPPQASRAGPGGVEGFMVFSNGNPQNAGPGAFRPPY